MYVEKVKPLNRTHCEANSDMLLVCFTYFRQGKLEKSDYKYDQNTPSHDEIQ